MTHSYHFARALRLTRIFRHHPRRTVIVPLDHPVSTGQPATFHWSADPLLADLAAAGVDAVVLHKGLLRHIHAGLFQNMALIIHMSASTSCAPDPDAKCLVTDVEEAVSLGADAVSIHVNLGSLDERRQLEDLGRVSKQCDRWNIPLLAMVYPRGPSITDPHDPDLVLHAAMVAANLGADLVKTPHAGSLTAMADVATACPIPVLVAGGPKLAEEEEVLRFVEAAIDGGAAGVALGRNVFMSADPGALAARVAERVHARDETTFPMALAQAALSPLA
jgi:2-amino-4,5-dihydroxy-6-oxo-7-(phosphonooxy)heptanoate synthase